MTKQPTLFNTTTLQQRNLLFQSWEATGNISEACRRANVSRRTFYYWRERFEEGGYAALQADGPPKPQGNHRTPKDIEMLVIQLKRRHPTWGKLQIAQQIQATRSDTQISPKTVRRILRDAGLWSSN
ncbi:MAG: helix-turn-helix domain-containing protein [Chloroflexota bacterium]